MTRLLPLAAVAIFAGLAMAAASIAGAASSPPPMAGAGQLIRNGKADCSGVLIAPGLVATAAHCVGGRVQEPGGENTIAFRTGAYPGHLSVEHEVTEILRHPLSQLDAVGGGLGADIAVLRLGDPIPPEVARPIAPGAPGAEGEDLLLATWPGGRGKRARERRCVALDTRSFVLVVSCRVTPGESGGAMVRLTDAGPELAAIVVARGQAGRQPYALGVQVQSRLAQIEAVHGF